jgi:hypothetical protein
MSKKVVVDLNVNTGKSEEDVKKVTEQTTDLKDSLKDVETQTKKTNKVLGGIKKVLSGLFIIQGLQVAFDLFKETLGKNQKVVDAFSTATEALSLAFNDLFTYLSNNVGTIIEYFKGIFSDPQQALKDFGIAIKQNLIERFNSALEVLGYLGTAIKKVFEGDFDGAMEAAKNAGKEYVDVLTGVDNSVDKIVEGTKEITSSIVNYAKSTVKAAKDIVDLNKQAELSAVINQGLIEKYDRQAEQQRQIRDDESKTIEARIAANNKLGKILEEQEIKMLANAKTAEQAALLQLNKDKENLEAQIAYQEALNETAAIEAQIEGFRSEQLINKISLQKELDEIEQDSRDAKIFQAEEDLKQAEEDAKKRKELINDTLDAVIDAAGAETKVGKALFLAKQAIRIQEQIEQAKATLQELGLIAAKSVADTASGAASTAKVGFPQNIPLLIAFAGQAAGIISSIKSAVGAAKGQASAMGASGGSGGSISTPTIPTIAAQAPDFNVVGASGTNQLAQAINGQDKQPIKAYVVSNDVTNAQSLERNIVEGASIG